MTITKEIAEQNLQQWLNASLATATGQSYKIGSRQIERAHATEIIKMINFWQNQLAKFDKELANTLASGRVFRAIPRDL
ncbi:MAG TPA: DUF6148 family protein [Burkholderiales bacterium]|nr:DUF6148 family protein [Burkholderiales bacterium]